MNRSVFMLAVWMGFAGPAAAKPAEPVVAPVVTAPNRGHALGAAGDLRPEMHAGESTDAAFARQLADTMAEAAKSRAEAERLRAQLKVAREYMERKAAEADSLKVQLEARKADAVIDDADSQRILSMFEKVGKSEDRLWLLVALCEQGCERLSAEAAGKILGSMLPGQMPRFHAEQRLFYINDQYKAIKKAALPWGRYSGEEMDKYVLPLLVTGNDRAAGLKWIEAHKK